MFATAYDTATQIKDVMLGGGSIVDVIGSLLKGVAIGFMTDGMCKLGLGVVMKPIMTVFGLGSQVDQIQEAIKSGKPDQIAMSFVQLICMLFGLTSQCFTGDTLVSTEDGLRPIKEIQVGDYVWAEDTETGEVELKKVLAVSVTESDTLIHVTTEKGTKIDTTENHPFYVEGKGWTAAAELKSGDKLHTKDGEIETVSGVEVEKLEEAVKVYNLEVEDSHTYYVSADKVLVHNLCGEWKEVNESMSDFSRDYQIQITGRTGQAYVQNGVKFDGVKGGVLIDAKAKYSNFLNKKTGEFYSWFKGQESFLSQARRQLEAAEGAKIEWYFDEEISMQAVMNLFNAQGIKGIELIFQAPN